MIMYFHVLSSLDTDMAPLFEKHYNEVIMGVIASQITGLMIVYSTVYSGTDQRKHESTVSLAFVQGIHRGPVNSRHKWPETRKMFQFDDVIMITSDACLFSTVSIMAIDDLMMQ